MTIEEAVKALQDAVSRGASALGEQAEELIARLKRETEAMAEVNAGGLYERAAGVVVQDVDARLSGHTDLFAKIRVRLDVAPASRGDVYMEPGDALVPRDSYRVITFILPRK